jgi:peptidoglycan/LPS O-acetylase OafA/YrhL
VTAVPLGSRQLGARNPDYRADVDGLRAWAILAVVAFHAAPKLVPGGFVGVDVFFVISGFLITGIVRRGIAEQSFRFAQFYTRRALRLFPALLIVLVSVSLFGRLALFDDEQARLGAEVVGGAGFAANFVLLDATRYFDPEARLKPLLHLWSLGVEEQFYLVWPAMLVASARRRIPFALLIGSLGPASFALNVWLTWRSPPSAFFLPFGRFWEFLVGAAASAAMPALEGARAKVTPRLGDAAAVAAHLAILYAALRFDEAHAFPGARVLLPVLGAALALVAGPGAWMNRVLTSSKPIVWIGLVSYPLYLWHWPLLSFLDITTEGVNPAAGRLALIAVAFALAALTWRFVERPARFGGHGGPLACALLGGLAVVGAGGAWTWASKSGEHDSRRASLELTLLHRDSTVIEPACLLDASTRKDAMWCNRDRRESTRYVLLGDSHAAALYPGLVARSTEGHRWELMAFLGCEFMTGGVHKTSRDGEAFDARCRRLTQGALQAIVADTRVEGVLFAWAYRDLTLNRYAWEQDHEATGSADDLFVAGVSATISTLQRAHKSVALLVDNPEITERPADCVAARPWVVRGVEPKCAMARSEFDNATRALRADLERLRAAFGVVVVDPTETVYCDRAWCRVMTGEGASLYSYTDHLSDVGNARVASAILEATGWR